MNCSFGFVHIGRVGSVAATVSIATERYVTVCCSTSPLSRKNLLLLIPITFAVFYNIPKFFEIVECSEEEKYKTMVKSYFDQMVKEREESNINNMKRSPPPFLEIKKDLIIEPSNRTMSDDEASYNNVQQFLLTTNHSLVVDALQGNIAECDIHGIRVSDFRSNYWYILYYQFLSDLILVEILPWILVIVLNIIVWKTSQKFHARRLRLLTRIDPTRGKL